MLFYVAGPLSGQDGKIGAYSNVVKAVEVAEQLYGKGHHAYVPHLTVFQHKIIRRFKPDYVPTYERWLSFDFDLIKRCDALFYISSSPGADKEKEFAESLGIPVYLSIKEVPDQKEGV